MANLSAAEQRDLISTLARNTERYLIDSGCVESDDPEPDELFDTKTAGEIRDHVGIAPEFWQLVQARMIKAKIPLALRCGVGFYLGNGTEKSATLITPGAKGVKTRTTNLAMHLLAAEAAGSMAGVLEFARDTLGFDLAQLPEHFRVWNLQLPGLE